VSFGKYKSNGEKRITLQGKTHEKLTKKSNSRYVKKSETLAGLQNYNATENIGAPDTGSFFGTGTASGGVKEKKKAGGYRNNCTLKKKTKKAEDRLRIV